MRGRERERRRKINFKVCVRVCVCVREREREHTQKCVKLCSVREERKKLVQEAVTSNLTSKEVVS